MVKNFWSTICLDTVVKGVTFSKNKNIELRISTKFSLKSWEKIFLQGGQIRDFSTLAAPVQKKIGQLGGSGGRSEVGGGWEPSPHLHL